MTFLQKINTISPKQFFLIDGLGAAVSAFMLGVVLVQLDVTGMPTNVLYILAFIPCVFMAYSFSCFFRLPENWQPYLKIIAIANLFYCCLTMGLMIYLYEKLTILGFFYFIGEIIIVVTLAMFELKVALN